MIPWKVSKVTFGRSGKLHLIHTVYVAHPINPGSTLSYSLWSLPTVTEKFLNEKVLESRVEINVEEATVCISQSWNTLSDRNCCPYFTDEETEVQKGYNSGFGL